MSDLPPEAYEDCFHPPSIPTEVFCLHCQRTYDSYLIEWRERDAEATGAEAKLLGFWCCPTPGCSGAGFGFDIHPVDPDYIDPDGREMGQWVDDGCGSSDEDCECLECRIACGELDPDELTDEERETIAEAQRAREEGIENPFDETIEDGCEMCTCGAGDEFEIKDDDENVIPLDDLLPVNEEEGEEIYIGWDLMMEIEEKCGLRERRPKESPANPPSPSRRDHPPISEDDIPF